MPDVDLLFRPAQGWREGRAGGARGGWAARAAERCRVVKRTDTQQGGGEGHCGGGDGPRSGERAAAGGARGAC